MIGPLKMMIRSLDTRYAEAVRWQVCAWATERTRRAGHFASDTMMWQSVRAMVNEGCCAQEASGLIDRLAAGGKNAGCRVPGMEPGRRGGGMAKV